VVRAIQRSAISTLSADALDAVQRGTLRYEWRGVLCCKNPFDLALYQKLLWHSKPGTLIEIGTYFGGSALWFADMTRAMGLRTQIISIDIQPFDAFRDERIEFRQGNSMNLESVFPAAEMETLARPLLVIDDASHHHAGTLAAMRFFDRWTRPGEYLIIEDGIIESMGAAERYDGGPSRAITEFLAETGDRYMIDPDYCDYFGYNVTWNTNGYLKRTGRT
jgi:cephalosporin hydroxylase